MRAIGRNILIKKIEQEVKTDSGLLLSADDVNDFRYQKGKVLLSGHLVEAVSDGDTIYYDTRQAYTIVIEGDSVTVINENAVVVVL